jgi:hypothetical protein
MSCGKVCALDGTAKAGTGGRAGGAFSLSVACDSWLDIAFWGRGLGAVSAGAIGSAGSGGKSPTICRE